MLIYFFAFSLYHAYKNIYPSVDIYLQFITHLTQFNINIDPELGIIY